MTNKPLKILLDPKHKIFADTYLATGRIGESARKAGYAPKSSNVAGNKLLKRPDVAEYLRTQANKVTEQTEDLQSRVLKEFEDMAFANIADFITVDKDGLPQVDFSGATREQLKAISSVVSRRKTTKQRNGDVILDEESRFTMSDKYRGLENLGKHLGMFKADEQRVVVDVADRLLNARRRLADAANRDAE